jgi:hypothetical protein
VSGKNFISEQNPGYFGEIILPRTSILIVEDESTIALDIRNNLESNDYQVIGSAMECGRQSHCK